MSALNHNEPSAMGPREAAAARAAAHQQPAADGQQQQTKATGAGVNTGAGTTREKTEAELQADREYEERMEEEYAKRDGVFGQQFSATCYAPDGTAASDGSYMPCSFSGGASMCCPTNGSSTSTNGGSGGGGNGDPRSGSGSSSSSSSRDACTEGGLCISQSDGKTRRGYCTDQSWKSSACVDICTDPSAGGSSSGAAILNYCPNEQNTYCCGDGNTTCCGTYFAHTLSSSATITLSTVVSTAFVTYTPSTSASGDDNSGSHRDAPLSGAARDALSTGGKAGVGIGAGVGGLALIGAASALLYARRRRQQKKKQSSKMDEAEGSSSSSATDSAAAAAAAAAGERGSESTLGNDHDATLSSPTKSELGGQALERRPNELDGEGARFEVPATAITTGGKREPGAIFELEGDPVSPVELEDRSAAGSPREKGARRVSI